MNDIHFALHQFNITIGYHCRVSKCFWAFQKVLYWLGTTSSKNSSVARLEILPPPVQVSDTASPEVCLRCAKHRSYNAKR